MPSPASLIHGEYYHIYNRGNNLQDIFLEEENYRFFLSKYSHYITPLADTFAYCLLRNHFHFLVRIKEVDGLKPNLQDKKPGHIFGRLFNSYAKSFNKRYGHKGSLFQNPFGRVRIETTGQLYRIVTYIHQNPQKHGYVDDFREWKFSSYRALIGSGETQLGRNLVLEWFEGVGSFINAHELIEDHDLIKMYVHGDVD
jgi:REP element-mobilizing transposase RayT